MMLQWAEWVILVLGKLRDVILEAGFHQRKKYGLLKDAHVISLDVFHMYM